MAIVEAGDGQGCHVGDVTSVTVFSDKTLFPICIIYLSISIEKHKPSCCWHIALALVRRDRRACAVGGAAAGSLAKVGAVEVILRCAVPVEPKTISKQRSSYAVKLNIISSNTTNQNDSRRFNHLNVLVAPFGETDQGFDLLQRGLRVGHSNVVTSRPLARLDVLGSL